MGHRPVLFNFALPGHEEYPIFPREWVRMISIADNKFGVKKAGYFLHYYR